MTYIPQIPATEFNTLDIYRGQVTGSGSTNFYNLLSASFDSTWRYARIFATHGHSYKGGGGNSRGLIQRAELILDAQRWVWQQYHYMKRAQFGIIQFGSNLWSPNSVSGLSYQNVQVQNVQNPGDTTLQILGDSFYILPYTPSSHPDFGDTVVIKAKSGITTTWYANILMMVYREVP